MENFRSPNFELVAELLYWLLRRCVLVRNCLWTALDAWPGMVLSVGNSPMVSWTLGARPPGRHPCPFTRHLVIFSDDTTGFARRIDLSRLCMSSRVLTCRKVWPMKVGLRINEIGQPYVLSSRTRCRRYDPDTSIPDDIDTPHERVQFLQDIAQAMFVKARVKLNIKRLYAADGKAVRELLKLADLLYRASMQAQTDPQVCAAAFFVVLGE